MIKRIREYYKQYRLPLLLLVLLIQPNVDRFERGTTCDIDEGTCENDPYSIEYEEIWLQENVPSVHQLKLVPDNKSTTVSNVTWTITSAPGESMIKPGGYEITPTSGEQVSLKLDPQAAFTELASARYYDFYTTGMGVRVGFTSSAEQGPQVLEDTIRINGLKPLLVARSMTGSGNLIAGKPLKGERALVDSEYFAREPAVRASTLTVAVESGDRGKPYQFSATVAPSNRKYVAINKIESVDALTAKIYMTFVKAADVGTYYTFPMYLKADGANGLYAMAIVDCGIYIPDQ